MIKVHVPATSGNCCIGFDSLGMAFNWWSTFQFERAHTLWISGCDSQFGTPNNLVVQAFYKTCEYMKVKKPPFHLRIDTTIPNQHGFGSSAMCIVAGIAGANAWFGNTLSQMEMFELAAEMEGHPDNVAPAIYGSLVVSYQDDNQIWHVTSIPCAHWHALAMIPSTMISTKEARKVLPDMISHKKASLQVAHAISFVQALQTGNQQLLLSSCKDYLHEPYRSKLIPDYKKIHNYCLAHQIPMWISGSGSTMIALDLERSKLDLLSSYVEMPNYALTISKKGTYIDE